MKWLFVLTLAVAAALTLGACEAQDSGAPDTSATTASLLSGTPRGASTLMGDPDLPMNAGQDIDLETLGYDRGDPGSPIHLLEMSDYGCGYCRKFHMETFPTLLSQFVETGNAEAGLVASSIANQRLGADERVAVLPIDPGLHGPIVQVIAVVGTTRHPEAARRFVELVTGPEGAAALRSHGFTAVSGQGEP